MAPLCCAIFFVENLFSMMNLHRKFFMKCSGILVVARKNAWIEKAVSVLPFIHVAQWAELLVAKVSIGERRESSRIVDRDLPD
jgi:hypothetical protein